MNTIQDAIDYLKQDGEFSDCKEQIEMADDAQTEYDQMKKRLQWWLENYDLTMLCGHKNRYWIAHEKKHNGCCAMCRIEKLEAQ